MLGAGDKSKEDCKGDERYAGDRVVGVEIVDFDCTGVPAKPISERSGNLNRYHRMRAGMDARVLNIMCQKIICKCENHLNT